MRFHQDILFRRSKGFSLLELSVLLVFVSLALVPLVRMIGGPSSSSGNGNAVQVSSLKNKEAILANTMVDKVLAGDFSYFRCGGNGQPQSFNPKNDLPKDNGVHRYGKCLASTSNVPVYYEWSIQNLDGMPTKNLYYRASFNVSDEQGNNLLSMPVHFFYNDGAFEQSSTRTGVMLSMDISGSMAYYAKNVVPYFEGSNSSYFQNVYFSSPYMFYRYKNFPSSSSWGNFPNNPPDQVVLNPWDDSQLDLTIGKQIAGSNPAGKDPNPDTPFNDAFPFAKVSPFAPGAGTWGEGVLGSGDCSVNNPSNWANDKNFKHAFILPYASSVLWGPYYGDPGNTLRELCGQKSSESDWSNTINTYLSRIEAARTAAVSLLVNLESTKSVAESIQLGFIPWDHYVHTQQMVNMESAQSIPGVTGLHFKNMRERLLWINRADPASKNSGNPVMPSGATSIYDGTEYARSVLMSKDYDRRIIVLLTDGAPTYGAIQSASGLKNYALNTFGNNASKNNQVTLFTVGLIAADNNLLDGMASSTPNGQNFEAKDVADLKPIFDAISYQIQKLALLSTADRYGRSF